jgi:hypothetical protein
MMKRWVVTKSVGSDRWREREREREMKIILRRIFDKQIRGTCVNGSGRQTRPNAGYSISDIKPSHDVSVALQYVPVWPML